MDENEQGRMIKFLNWVFSIAGLWTFGIVLTVAAGTLVGLSLSVWSGLQSTALQVSLLWGIVVLMSTGRWILGRVDFYGHHERVKTTRLERLKQLKQYFLRNLVEDPQDGTTFDCDVLDAIERLERRYQNEGQQSP